MGWRYCVCANFMELHVLKAYVHVDRMKEDVLWTYSGLQHSCNAPLSDVIRMHCF